VRLWTVRAADELRSARWPLRADPRFVDPYMLPAYRWMAGQLRRKAGPPPRGVTLPLWAWVTRPDLRTSAHLPKGRKGVVLELELPEPQVLVSDFERFHAVLNRHYLALNQADDARFDRALARSGRTEWPFTPAIRTRVEQSWRRIFSDVRGEGGRRYWGAPEHAALQAVFWELPQAAVVGRRAFVAR